MKKKRISKKSKRRLIIFGVISVFAIAYFLVTLGSYVYNYASLIIEEKALKEELVLLQGEKTDLKIEIQKLNNPDYVARYAKENYLYSADGEYVLKIDSNNEEKINEVKDNTLVYVVVSGIVILSIVIFIIKKKNSSKWTIFIV